MLAAAAAAAALPSPAAWRYPSHRLHRSSRSARTAVDDRLGSTSPRHARGCALGCAPRRRAAPGRGTAPSCPAAVSRVGSVAQGGSVGWLGGVRALGASAPVRPPLAPAPPWASALTQSRREAVLWFVMYAMAVDIGGVCSVSLSSL